MQTYRMLPQAALYSKVAQLFSSVSTIMDHIFPSVSGSTFSWRLAQFFLDNRNNEMEESTHDLSYQSGGGSHTTIINKTAEKYSKECDRMISDIAKKVMSVSFIEEISFDLKEISDLHQKYDKKAEELEKFRVLNKIPYLSLGGSGKEIDPEIMKEYIKFQEIKTEAWNCYTNGIKNIKKKWKNKLETSFDNTELNQKYQSLVNSVKNISKHNI